MRRRVTSSAIGIASMAPSLHGLRALVFRGFPLGDGADGVAHPDTSRQRSGRGDLAGGERHKIMTVSALSLVPPLVHCTERSDCPIGGSAVFSAAPRRTTTAGYLRLSMRQFSVLAKLSSGANLTQPDMYLPAPDTRESETQIINHAALQV